MEVTPVPSGRDEQTRSTSAPGASRRGSTVAVIRLEGLSVFGHHGASLAERKAGTRLDVDVMLDIDTARAEASDQLSDTVSYDVIEALVRKVVEAESFRLLEALAARVAETCLRKCRATR